MSDQTKGKTSTALQKVDASKKGMAPVFVEAEKMFEKMSEVAREIGARAHEFFQERGGEFGREVEDWFKAENEILRPAPVEIRESDGNIYVTAAVPGFNPEEIEVSVKDNVLMLSGTTSSTETTDKANTIVKEWKSNKFSRQLVLPSAVVGEKVEATLSKGMLELTLPKAAEQEATKVAVKGA